MPVAAGLCPSGQRPRRAKTAPDRLSMMEVRLVPPDAANAETRGRDGTKPRLREGSPFPLGATWTGLGLTSPFSPPLRPRSSCACSTIKARRKSSASSCPNTPTRSGTASSTYRLRLHARGFYQAVSRRAGAVAWHVSPGLPATPSVVEYPRRLGFTAVELLPIHTFVDDPYLLEKGLVNYWGYPPPPASMKAAASLIPAAKIRRCPRSN